MFDKSQMSESFDVPAGCVTGKVKTNSELCSLNFQANKTKLWKNFMNNIIYAIYCIYQPKTYSS